MALTGLIGVVLMVLGVWPLIFTDVPTADDEFAEQMGLIFLGMIFFAWASATGKSPSLYPKCLQQFWRWRGMGWS